MAPNRRAVGATWIATAIGVVVLLVIWPGYALRPTGWTESVELALATCPQTGPINSTPVGTFLFHTVTFQFWVHSAGCHVPGFLNVTGTESNGVSSSHQFNGFPSPGTVTWVSPDGKFSVQYNGTRIVILTVEA